MSDAAHAAPADAAHDAGHHVNYMAKFYWLVALTVIEVAVAIWVPGVAKAVGLTVLSIWKAAIVLNYFMHMKTEAVALKLAMCFPLLLVFVLLTLFLTDSHFLGYAGT